MACAGRVRAVLLFAIVLFAGLCVGHKPSGSHVCGSLPLIPLLENLIHMRIASNFPFSHALPPLHATAPRQPLLGTSTIPRVRPVGDRRAAREDMSCRDSEVCDHHNNMSSMNTTDERCDLGATGVAYCDCGGRVLEAAL